MKKFRVGALAMVGAMLLPMMSACGTSNDEDSVSLMMDVGYLPKHAPFFAAVERGFFEEEGLRVSLMPGSGSNNTVTSVETGRVFGGFADFGVTVMNQGRGAQVKQVNLLQARSAYATVAPEGSDIRSWEDLKGKTVATEGAGAMTSMWPYALGNLGYSESDINVVHASSESKIPGLLAGQWDANLALSVSDAPALSALGIEPVVLKWSDLGIALYGNGLVISDATLENEPDKVRKFNSALQRGFLWACDNPEEAYADFNREVQGYTQETVVLAINEQCALNWPDEATTDPFGAMSDEGVQEMVDVAHDFLGLDPMIDLSPAEIYSNDYLTPIHKNDAVAAP